MACFYTALVTGANRGLGLEFCRQLLTGGTRVIATCRQPQQADALHALAELHPQQLHVLALDVADAHSRAALVNALPRVLGDAGIDLLVLNAGVLHAGERFGQLDAALIEESFRTNALAPLLLTEALREHLRTGARVLAMSSRLGSMACTQRFGTPGYAISKAALNMVVAQLSHALKPQGIAIAACSPGWARTDMGGPDAEVDPVDAVAGLIEHISQLSDAQTGSFFDWKGQQVDW